MLSESDMTAELLARTVSERMFTRQLHAVEKLLKNPDASTRIVERQLTTLCMRWTSLQETHDEYVIQFVSDPIDIATNDSFIESYGTKFMRLEFACDQFISSHTAINLSAQCSQSAIHETNSIKLERVRFRIFDGDIRKYPKFKSEFQQFVQPLSSPSQVTFVLKSYLCDSVRRVIENCDHQIEAMWERLDAKYGTIRKQIDCIMSDFKNLNVCTDSSSTLNMIELVETAEADLKCLNASSELENSTIIALIEECMPRMMFDHWALKIANDDDASDSKFQKLHSFLQHWKRTLEYNDADIRQTHNSDPVKSTSRKCLVHHEEDHPIWRCRAFKAMTVDERRRVVTSNNACMLCLEKGHDSENCHKKFRCTSPGCHSSHNVLFAR